jgi:hypothetical protein
MNKLTLLVLSLFIGLYYTGNGIAGEKEDCVNLSQAAAEMMKTNRDSALTEINKNDGKFVIGVGVRFVNNYITPILHYSKIPGDNNFYKISSQKSLGAIWAANSLLKIHRE